MTSTHQEEAAAGDLLAAALAYAADGLLVLPLDGKVPRNRGGLTNATTDPAVIAEWWQRWPDANVGIRTGAESGLVALDVDTPKGGAKSLAEFERKHGEVPPTARVLTGGGGQHIYFTYPGRELRNSSGRLGDGLDIRGDGGYVVAPPSVHESGHAYRWMRGLDRGLAEPPAWLIDSAETSRNGSAPSVGDAIPEGKRDATLASLAGTMRRRGMGEAAIRAALLVENERCQPPLPQPDIERIARSIAVYPPAQVQSHAQLEPFTLEVTTARDLCAQPDPDRSDELLGPLVVERYRTLIGAHTGEGKTTAALAMQRAILDGSDWLGFTGRGGVRGLLLDAEQGTRSLKRRLREAGLDGCDRLDVIRVPDGLCLDADPRHVTELDRILRTGGYSVVNADPLYKLHAGDSNAEREAVDLMRRFDAWRDELGFALILPIHCRKPVPGLKFSIHDLFGSSAYVRGAEIVLGLQRLRDGYSRLHFLKDRDGDLPIGNTWGLLFDRDEGFRRDPDDGKHEPTTAEQIAELLEQTPWMTKAALVAATGRKLRTVETALRELGTVTRRPGGGDGRSEHVYALPDTEPDPQPIDTRSALFDD